MLRTTALRTLSKPCTRCLSTATTASPLPQQTESQSKRAEKMMRRFWKTVALEKRDQDEWAVLLDKRTLKTPGGLPLLMPKERLPVALLIAEEWENQVAVLKPHTLPMTSIASRALDGLGSKQVRSDVVAGLLKYLDTDTVCFHEDFPERLVQLQEKHWSPLLEWVRSNYSVELNVYEGILNTKQPDATILKLGSVVADYDAFKLAAFERSVLASKSYLIALGLVEGFFTVDQAAQAAHVEVQSQIDRWGEVEDTHDVDHQDVRVRLGSAALRVSNTPALTSSPSFSNSPSIYQDASASSYTTSSRPAAGGDNHRLINERSTRGGGFLYRSKSYTGNGKDKARGLQLRRGGKFTKRGWFVVVTLFSTLWFILGRIIHLTSHPFVPCNAFQVPGRLHMNLTSPLHTLWLPMNPSTCPALPPYLPQLYQLTHGPHRKFPLYPSSTFPPEYSIMSPPEPLPLSLHSTYYLRSSEKNQGPPIGSKKDSISFLRKKRKHPPTILLLGDSVDRNGLVHFCQLFKREVTISLYSDIDSHPPGPYPPDLTKGHGPKFEGWDQRGLMHLCEIPHYSPEGGSDGERGRVAMRVLNGFHYGMDQLDEFNTPDHTDWHAPGRIEKRIDRLVLPAIEQLNKRDGGTGNNARDKIDLVQIHSGMWDLALFGMQDDKHHFDLTTPLSPEQLAWWQERMSSTIIHIRQRFPKSRIVFRKLHRTDDSVQGTQYITNLRVNQLRHLQEELARSFKLETFDFGKPLEGYQLFQEKVHPLLVPGGVVYAQNLVHQLRLAVEGRTSWRRGWLWDD